MNQICQVGSPAPEFELPAVTPGGECRTGLSQYRGSWLALIFYPRDFSFVCPSELTAFSAELAAFEQRNCHLLAISIDDLETHRAWLETDHKEGGVRGLRYPLASDAGGDVCRAYGLFREEEGLPNRGLFLVDPEGVLRYASIHDLAVGRSTEDVIRVLDALQSGGLCPANWTSADGVLDLGAMLQPGRVLGHYKIEKQVGQGSFGAVLAARDLRLDRQVALKIIYEDAVESEQQLLAEARTIAGIQHPNVCSIFAVERHDGLATIVMEYLDGQTLADRIRKGFDESAFRVIAKQLAGGLGAAHEQGVIHGDLKPANVIFRNEDTPVIIDFGLSNPVGQTGESTQLDADLAATFKVDATSLVSGELVSGESEGTPPLVDRTRRTHTISGTPLYMSPEQASGEPLTTATDVFSLGVICLEMLTGENPLKEMRLIEILTGLRSGELSERLQAAVPQRYRSVIQPMLDRVPANRPSAVQLEFN